MNTIISILHISSPLLLITLAALISEYAGRLAMFLENQICLGAFFCFTFGIFTQNIIIAYFLSILFTTLITLALEQIASKLNSNIFIAALAMNLIFLALISLLSSIIFKTKGILFSPEFNFDPSNTKIITTVISLIVSISVIFVLNKTSFGLRLKLSGKEGQLLETYRFSQKKYQSISWIICSILASLSGCIYCTRISSYVPGMSGGRAWIALSIVFLGKKNPLLITISIVIYSLVEYISTHIQNFEFFKNTPSSLLLALPYILSILLIFIIPKKNK